MSKRTIKASCSSGSPNRPVILLTDPIDPGAVERLSLSAAVASLGDPGFEEIGPSICKSDIVIVRRKIPPHCLHKADRLKALIRHGVGLDFIPVQAASELGIAVVNTPGTNATSVAEASLGMMLSGYRRIAFKDRLIRNGRWNELRNQAFSEQEISGKRLGVVGLGSIGREIARIAHFGFGMAITAVIRSHRSVPSHIRVASLQDALRESDVLVLACPLTSETMGMIGAEELAAMKAGSAIVNIARGAIVQEPALIEALASGHLAFAALDVFEQQPLDQESQLLQLDNVVLTPHTAGITAQAVRNMSRIASEEAIRILNFDRPVNLVNATAWQAIAARWHAMRTEHDQ